ncbi:MAG: carbohydrate-binding family V/XII [Acidobacteria bacterium]|nr:carbohydrate-binding family V/XII [Acidobacteriota bacterium]
MDQRRAVPLTCRAFRPRLCLIATRGADEEACPAPRLESSCALVSASSSSSRSRSARSIPSLAERASWPREVRSGDAKITLYQPQPDSLDGNVVTARAAISVDRKGSEGPVFGAIWVTAELEIDRESDLALVAEVTVDRVRFPGLADDDPKAADLKTFLEKEVPTWELEFTVDEIRRSLEAVDASVEGLRHDPPKIIVSDRPAILISFDGDPKLDAIENTPFQRIINSPFPIVFDPSAKRYYLYGSVVWFAAADPLGEWKPIDSPPKAVADLFAARADSGDEAAPPDAGESVPPEKLRQATIYSSTEPTELIVTDGAPEFQPLVEGDVLFVTNTDDDLFVEVETQRYFTVISGRWFAAPKLSGPWDFVDPEKLPAEFAKIPESSPKARVLAHVPGTDQAKDAVMDSIIPETAAVKRSEAKFDAEYDGDPEFEKIDGTKLRYAINTASQIIEADGRYYACEQGVWFVANAPEGPWSLSETRPNGVDDIPASSPVHNVRYVHIYDVTPDVVYVGYTPGYTWVMPYRGVVVYGTGWYYRPWYRRYYYPRFRTWGFHATYDPWYGWRLGMSWNVGWVTFSWGWGRHWGSWHHGYRHGYRNGYWNGYWQGYWDGMHAGGWWGPGGYRPRPPAAGAPPPATVRSFSESAGFSQSHAPC